MYQIKKKQKNQTFHGDLTNSLIQLAILQITTSKSISFSIRELSKKLGVSHAATYKHFKNKVELLETIALQGFIKLNITFQHSQKNYKGDLKHMVQTYIEFALQNSGYYRVMFGVSIDPNHNPLLHGASMETFHYLLDTIGKRDPVNVQKALSVWSLVHGWVMLRLDDQILGLLKQLNTSETEVLNFLSQSAFKITN